MADTGPWSFRMDTTQSTTPAAVPVKKLQTTAGRQARHRSEVDSGTSSKARSSARAKGPAGGLSQASHAPRRPDSATRPRSITLPAPFYTDSQALRSPSFGLATPDLAWNNTSLDGRLLSPSLNAMPGNPLTAMDAVAISPRNRASSIISSGSSNEGRSVAAALGSESRRRGPLPRSQSARSTTTLASFTGHRPNPPMMDVFASRPQPRARGLSLSLVIGAEGQAALQHDVDALSPSTATFDVNSSNGGGMRGEAMRRMASFAGSDVSVTRPLHTLSLGRGPLTSVGSGVEGSSMSIPMQSRSFSQQTDGPTLSTMPLTPLTVTDAGFGDSHSHTYGYSFVSPSMMRGSAAMQTPDSLWDSPESGLEMTSPLSSVEDGSPSQTLKGTDGGLLLASGEDARAAVQQVYDRRRGGPRSASLPTADLFINMMPVSPPAAAHRARHRHPRTCVACRMVFQSDRAHLVHVQGGCGVKQAPFLASDFYDAFEGGAWTIEDGFFGLQEGQVRSDEGLTGLRTPSPVQTPHARPAQQTFQKPRGSLLASPLLSGEDDGFGSLQATDASSEPHRKRSLVGTTVLAPSASPSQVRHSKRVR